MVNDSQNNSGFFKTQPVSKKSLIDGIPNFYLECDNAEIFSDSDLEIPERLMLGKRAERYFSEWIKQSDSYELIAENIQIIENKQTLGEFDFIIRRLLDNQLIHIELIYKFYLFDPSSEGTEIEKWIGPNRGDRLDFKRDKLANHQFPLLKTNPAKERLQELEIDVSRIEQQVLFLANLFVPVNQKVDFTQVNEVAVEGTWMNLEDWEKQASSENQYAIPAKMDWFSRELKNTEWLSREEALILIKSMHDQKRSPLVWVKNKSGTQLRDFVVFW
jgi:hypothetical protein